MQHRKVGLQVSVSQYDADGLADTNASAATPEQTQLSVERAINSDSRFTRTIYLSHPVNSGNIGATLADGILTIKAPKAEEVGSVQVPIQ